MKRHTLVNIFAVAAILVGCSVLLYPTVSNYLNQKNSTFVIDGYDETVDEMGEEEKQEILQEAYEYNRNLTGYGAQGDPFTSGQEQDDDPYWSVLRMDENGLMGYIRIPSIHVELPIYHGTSEGVLQRGAGHWKGSSLPVGGEGTHAVLTGHSGLPTKELFSNLSMLACGDVFYIRMLDDTLAYQIDQILTVLPDETESLAVEDGKDYVTLVTCTPYAVNTHRLLVRGHRIPYEEAVDVQADEVTADIWIPIEVKAALSVVAVLVVIFIVYRLRRKRSYEV